MMGVQRKGPSFEPVLGLYLFYTIRRKNSFNSSSSEGEGTVVTPVDTSFAAAVNAELSTAAKNTLVISADSSLEAALKNVMDKIDSKELAAAVGNKKIGFVTNSDAEDLRHLLGFDDDAGLTAVANNSTHKLVAYEQPTAVTPATGSGEWMYFKNSVDSVKTTIDLIVVDGEYTDEGLAETVADTLKALIVEARMPNNGTVGTKNYDYDYTGNIASVKVDNLRGDNSYYVVALKVVQTPTEVTNG